jgi:hypothetical protein
VPEGKTLPRWVFSAKTVCCCCLLAAATACFVVRHTTYSRNNMGQKCEGNCGLWVFNEMIKNINPENLKKIVGAVWELPAK